MKEKIKTILAVTGMLLVLGCNNSKRTAEKDSHEIVEGGFKSYYDSLDLIETPLKINGHYWDSVVDVYMTKYGPIKSSSIFENPFARIFDDKNYKGILFISPDESGSPVLVTFDRNDHPIDTVFLLGDISSNNPEQWTIEEADVMKDRTIHLLDSVSRWEVDSNGARILNTKKTTVESKNYRIVESGEIEENK